MASAAVVMAISGAFTAVTTVIGAIQQNKIHKYNAKVAENDAIAAEQRSKFESEKQQRRAKIMQGRLANGLAGNGGDLTEGSPLSLLAESAYNAEVDRQVIIYEGAVSASRSRARAEGERAAGRAALTSGILKGVSQGVGAFGRYSSMTGGVQDTVTGAQSAAAGGWGTSPLGEFS